MPKHRVRYLTSLFFVIFFLGLIGEVQLQQYGNFLEKYNTDLSSLTKKLSNRCNVRLELILLEVGDACENYDQLNDFVKILEFSDGKHFYFAVGAFR